MLSALTHGGLPLDWKTTVVVDTYIGWPRTQAENHQLTIHTHCLQVLKTRKCLVEYLMPWNARHGLREMGIVSLQALWILRWCYDGNWLREGGGCLVLRFLQGLWFGESTAADAYDSAVRTVRLIIKSRLVPSDEQVLYVRVGNEGRLGIPEGPILDHYCSFSI